MKKHVFLLPFYVFVFQSCCVVYPSSAQHDVYDTHKPTIALVECIGCGDNRNTSEHFIRTEFAGLSGNYLFGIEPNFNFNRMSINAFAGVGYWPWPAKKTAFAFQFGFIAVDPNNRIRPEIGFGYNGLLVRGPENAPIPIHPAKQAPLYSSGNFNGWHGYAGVRIDVPQSNMNISLRIYRLQFYKPASFSAFYPGIQLGFRFHCG
jgi:hypothetical protein